MKTIIIVSYFFIISSNILAQIPKVDTSIEILTIDGSARLYSKEKNLIIVLLHKDSIKNYLVKTTQGMLEIIDSIRNGKMLFLNYLEPGKVTLTVFRKNSDGLNPVSYKNFTVIKKPLSKEEAELIQLTIKPEINIGGFKSGEIPLDVIKNTKQININKPYQIEKIVISCISNNKDIKCELPDLHILNSNKLDKDIIRIFKGLPIGYNIILDEIIIKNDKGILYKLKPIIFKVCE